MEDALRAPKCRLCGAEHWGSCPTYAAPPAKPSRSPPAASKPKSAPLPPPEPEPVPEPSQAPYDPALVKAEPKPKKARKPKAAKAPKAETREPRKRGPKGSFDRQEYMRNYMKARRRRLAAEREGGAVK